MEHIPQDYLGGDLSGKTIIELKELLERQEKLLKKKNFLKNLPDKGIKVESFAEKLKKLINERESRVISHEQITQKPISKFRNEKVQNSTNDHTTVKIDKFSALVAQESEMVEPHSGSVSSAENDSSREKVLLTNLEETLVKMDIGSEGDVKYPAGEHLLHFLEQTESHKKKIPFMLNRELKISKVEELPPEFQCPGKTQHQKMDSNEQKKITSLWQETAVGPLNYKYSMAKEMSLPESMRLQEEQKIKQEESQALFAAGRLAERLNIKMESFNPEGRDMSYREVEVIDSDDDLEDLDGVD